MRGGGRATEPPVLQGHPGRDAWKRGLVEVVVLGKERELESVLWGLSKGKYMGRPCSLGVSREGLRLDFGGVLGVQDREGMLGPRIPPEQSLVKKKGGGSER